FPNPRVPFEVREEGPHTVEGSVHARGGLIPHPGPSTRDPSRTFSRGSHGREERPARPALLRGEADLRPAPLALPGLGHRGEGPVDPPEAELSGQEPTNADQGAPEQGEKDNPVRGRLEQERLEQERGE